MFGSTAILPPRTKRWAEAKVLADCINLKVRFPSSPWHPKSTMSPRYASSTYTTTSMRLRSHTTTVTCVSLQTFRVGGGSARRHSSSGAGLLGSAFVLSPLFPSDT